MRLTIYEEKYNTTNSQDENKGREGNYPKKNIPEKKGHDIHTNVMFSFIG